MLERKGQRLAAAAGFDRAESGKAQHVAYELRVLRVVVDDQDELVRHSVIIVDPRVPAYTSGLETWPIQPYPG